MTVLNRLQMVLIVGALVGFERAAADNFQHGIDSTVQPWTHLDFDAGDEKFTFALFSDLTGGERDGVFATAIEQLNLLRPELIVNVGDLIEGGTEDKAELSRQWNSFDDRANQARAPVFYAGGNHDLTGLTLREVWKERLGPRYYHFVYRKVLFLVLDTEDHTSDRMQEIEQARLDAVSVYRENGPEAFAQTGYAKMPERSAGTVGVDQSRYFQKVLSEYDDVRWTFVLIHKPAWEREQEKNFAAIETALADRPYTVFYGHTHVYDHTLRYGRDYINLATTGGEQFPADGLSVDHITLVTVDDDGVSIANLRLDGLFDKKGENFSIRKNQDSAK